MNRILILSEGPSDLSDLILKSCAGSELRAPDAPFDIKEFDALCLLCGNREKPITYPSPVRACIEAFRATGKPVFAEFVEAIGGSTNNGITETTAQVYIRALKRVIRAHGITDVETLIERIDELIDAYQGKDQKAHNVHISVLKQFDAYVQDPNGFVIAVQKDGKEQIVSRIYSTITAAESEMDFVGDDYRGEADKVVLYDKFKRFVKERDL